MTEATTPAASTAEARAILLAARELIADPAHWCTRAYARTAGDRSVYPFNPCAAQWCVTGAMWRVVGQSLSGTAYFRALGVATRAARAAGWDSLSEANDNLNHAGVLAILDAALASLAEPEVASRPHPNPRPAERGEMSCREAGRRGGLVIRDRYGPEHFRAIGRRGGAVTASRFDTEHFAAIGRIGGARTSVRADLTWRAARDRAS